MSMNQSGVIWSSNPTVESNIKRRFYNIPTNYKLSAEESKWLQKYAAALGSSSLDEIKMGLPLGALINNKLDAAGLDAANYEAEQYPGADAAPTIQALNAVLTLKAVMQLLTMAENVLQGGISEVQAAYIIPDSNYNNIGKYPVADAVQKFLNGQARRFVSSDPSARDDWSPTASPASASAIQATKLHVYLFGRLDSLVQAYHESVKGVKVPAGFDGAKGAMAGKRIPSCPSGAYPQFYNGNTRVPLKDVMLNVGGKVVYDYDAFDRATCAATAASGGAFQASRRRGGARRFRTYHQMKAALKRYRPRMHLMGKFMASRSRMSSARRGYGLKKSTASRAPRRMHAHLARAANGQFLPRGSTRSAAYKPKSYKKKKSSSMRAMPARNSKGRFVKSGSKSRYRACTAPY